jgi:hypothetical protein
MSFAVGEFRVDVFHHCEHLPGNDLRLDLVGIECGRIMAERALHAQTLRRLAHSAAAKLIFAENLQILGRSLRATTGSAPGTSTSGRRCVLRAEDQGKNSEQKG